LWDILHGTHYQLNFIAYPSHTARFVVALERFCSVSFILGRCIFLAYLIMRRP